MKKLENFYQGINVQQSSNLLSKLSLFDIYMSITEPNKKLIESIHQLLEIKSLGKEAYRKLKARLPYFIGSSFIDNIRRNEHFIEANWFVIDIDHLLINLEDEEKYKSIFSKDSRVALMFTSPGSEGLKLVFKLKQPITNTKVFSNFYTAFSAEFARHYQMENFLDFTTKDASRVCFFSVDPKAYINENFLAVNVDKYISKYDLLNNDKDPNHTKEKDETITNDVYANILLKLNPKTPKRKKDYFVPEVLISIMSPIENKARKMGLPITDKKDISYGQQITFTHNQVFSIINLYYGKHGFTVQITNKASSNFKLGEVCKALIEDVIYHNTINQNPFENSQQEVRLKALATENILKN